MENQQQYNLLILSIHAWSKIKIVISELERGTIRLIWENYARDLGNKFYAKKYLYRIDKEYVII